MHILHAIPGALLYETSQQKTVYLNHIIYVYHGYVIWYEHRGWTGMQMFSKICHIWKVFECKPNNYISV
jgi:hypothetical protein